MAETQETAGKSAVIERLSWQVAQRDDARVAQAVQQGEELDAVYELSEAGLLDGFFHFLEITGVRELIGQLTVSQVKRVLIPVAQMGVLYLLKTLYGIASMNALPPLLFSNVALMTLVGFNAHQVAQGFTRRGDDRRRLKRKAGPLSPQALAQNICKLTEEQMAAFFNGVVRRLVAWGFVQGEIMVALDGSKLPTTAKFVGRGCLAVEHKAKEKGTGRIVTVVRYVFGWKVLVLIEVRTRLPLALKVVRIEEYEGQWLLLLVQQAQANLGGRARITKVVIDRGYLDGADLWALHQMGLTFVVVGKAGMAVVEDAHALAQTEPAVERVRVVRQGHGRTATRERRRTVLVPIAGLTSYDAYGSPEHVRHKNRKDFAGEAINAVVVRLWNNRPPQGDGIVYLTNGPVHDPFVVFDDYDWRSVIENSIFKEGKHPWHLGRFPQKTAAAVLVHCHFTLAVMALCTAFRLWQAQGAPDTPLPPPHPEAGAAALSSALLQGEGTARWRRRLKEENRDKVIVFVGAHYGIFHVAEMAVLAGLRLKTLPPELGSPQAILHRYGLGGG